MEAPAGALLDRSPQLLTASVGADGLDARPDFLGGADLLLGPPPGVFDGPRGDASPLSPLPGNGALLAVPDATEVEGPQDESPETGEAAEADGAADVPVPKASFFDEAPAPRPAGPATRRKLWWLTPGLVIAVICLVAAIVVVGEVATHFSKSTPPNPDQVTGLTPAPPPASSPAPPPGH
jgi:hypothetical protein